MKKISKRRSFRKPLGGSQDFIREQTLVSLHKVNRSEISGEGRGMIQQTILTGFCLAGTGFMLYVLYSLQREIRREKRKRMGAVARMPHKQNDASIATLTRDTTSKANAFDHQKTPYVKPAVSESLSIGFDLQAIRKGSAGGSR